MAKNNGYELSRAWFDFAFENPSKVSSGHTALFMWLCEINNRLGWVSEFQITAGECMNGMSCKSYKTYKKALDELILFGFVKMVKQSVNQYQCNIIGLVNNTEASTNALTKSLLKHLPKQVQSTDQSTSHIHKPETKKQVNKKPDVVVELPFSSNAFSDAWTQFLAHRKEKKSKVTEKAIDLMFADFIAWGEDRSIKNINNSIKNGWTGVFDRPDSSSPGGQFQQKQEPQRIFNTLTDND